MIVDVIMADILVGFMSYLFFGMGTLFLAQTASLFMPNYFERLVAAMSNVDVKYQDGILTATTKGE